MSPSPASETADRNDPLHGKRVVLCVTGGIAAYKSAYLTRGLVRAGAEVMVIMTPNAQRFVGPLTFETLSGNPVVTSTFERVHALGAVEHIDLATWADVVLVAPASYDVLGKLHAGIADDAVTTFLAAVACPVFLAPAMNDLMWKNPVNQRNVQGLRALGYRIIDPERGGLACSWEGEGRMREPDTIVEALRGFVAAGPTTKATIAPRSTGGSLAGRTVLVTAGGTREAIDPVRYVGNRSSGRMGYALAAAAAARGARVLLVSGPTHLEAPTGVAEVARVESAAEMLVALQARLAQCDVLLMTAAVADYRPARVATKKLKRSADPLRLELEPAPDLLATLQPEKGGRFFVGFALETEAPETEARAKLARKGLDLVVANRVGDGTGPDTDTNRVWIYDAQGLVLETALLPKPQIATAILDVVEAALARKEAPARV